MTVIGRAKQTRAGLAEDHVKGLAVGGEGGIAADACCLTCVMSVADLFRPVPARAVLHSPWKVWEYHGRSLDEGVRPSQRDRSEGGVGAGVGPAARTACRSSQVILIIKNNCLKED